MKVPEIIYNLATSCWDNYEDMRPVYSATIKAFLAGMPPEELPVFFALTKKLVTGRTQSKLHSVDDFKGEYKKIPPKRLEEILGISSPAGQIIIVSLLFLWLAILSCL